MRFQRGFIANNLSPEKIAQQDKKGGAEKKIETLPALMVLKQQSPTTDPH